MRLFKINAVLSLACLFLQISVLAQTPANFNAMRQESIMPVDSTVTVDEATGETIVSYYHRAIEPSKSSATRTYIDHGYIEI